MTGCNHNYTEKIDLLEMHICLECGRVNLGNKDLKKVNWLGLEKSFMYRKRALYILSNLDNSNTYNYYINLLV